MRTIKVGSDFSGVGAFDYAIGRVAQAKGFKVQTVYACDWDKYARITYAHNHGEPPYYPKDVYEREIPTESLDIYMTSPPCQAFSLLGKRMGKQDKRGILFFNSHEFIQMNKPRFFIFENVKGLLSDDGGKTFSEWINMLGGKSVNGLPILFPYDDSVPYHIYWRVLNSKDHGVPQNRERVFIIGIRDDKDNKFQFPNEEHLLKKLSDIIDSNVDSKYLLKSIDNIKKLKQTLSKFNLPNKVTIIDSYNKTIHTEHSICISTRVNASSCTHIWDKNNIRRLTPRECFRLQDFPESFNFSVVSDSQAYKQAGNSITVRVLEKILMNLQV